MKFAWDMGLVKLQSNEGLREFPTGVAVSGFFDATKSRQTREVPFKRSS